MVIIDTFRAYYAGASISHSVRNHYRCLKGVLGWCFNISQEKKTIIDAFRAYKAGASISHRVRRPLQRHYR